MLLGALAGLIIGVIWYRLRQEGEFFRMDRDHAGFPATVANAFLHGIVPMVAGVALGGLVAG